MDTSLNNSRTVLELNWWNHKKTKTEQFRNKFPLTSLSHHSWSFSHGKHNHEGQQGAGHWRCQVTGRRPTCHAPHSSLRSHNERRLHCDPGTAKKPPRQSAHNRAGQLHQLQVTWERGTLLSPPALLEKTHLVVFSRPPHCPPHALGWAVRVRQAHSAPKAVIL